MATASASVILCMHVWGETSGGAWTDLPEGVVDDRQAVFEVLRQAVNAAGNLLLSSCTKQECGLLTFLRRLCRLDASAWCLRPP